MGDSSLKDSITYIENGVGPYKFKSKTMAIMYANNRNIINSIDVDNRESSTNFDILLEETSKNFDVVIIDCSLRIDLDIVNKALYRSDSIYMVMDENMQCLSNVSRVKSYMQIMGINVNKIRTIFNKRTDIKFPNIKKFGIEPIAYFPFDKAIISCGIDGQIFTLHGASNDKSAGYFNSALLELRDHILVAGGYKRGQKETS